MENQLFPEKLVFKEDETGTYFPTSSDVNCTLSVKLRSFGTGFFQPAAPAGLGKSVLKELSSLPKGKIFREVPCVRSDCPLSF